MRTNDPIGDLLEAGFITEREHLRLKRERDERLGKRLAAAIAEADPRYRLTPQQQTRGRAQLFDRSGFQVAPDAIAGLIIPPGGWTLEEAMDVADKLGVRWVDFASYGFLCAYCAARINGYCSSCNRDQP